MATFQLRNHPLLDLLEPNGHPLLDHLQLIGPLLFGRLEIIVYPHLGHLVRMGHQLILDMGTDYYQLLIFHAIVVA